MVELGGIIILGIIAQWLAWRLKVPAILPLIIIGLLVGPFSTLWSADGLKWIEPIWDGQHGLFPGDGLFHFVELSIGIILFEGGLTLKRAELKGVGDTIGKLISVGALITFLGGGLLAKFLIDLPWAIAFLFSGLIIVTGPTVIAPILRNLNLNKNVSTVLKWEGILIDPIGAIVAVLVYDFISTSGGAGQFTLDALKQFIVIDLVGLAFGVIAAFVFRALLKRDLVPHYLLTIFTLAFVLVVFVGSNLLAHDSGLLTVVVVGTVLGNIDVPYIKEIEYFKESLSILLISILFILLSANIDMQDLALLQNWYCIALFASVILVLRPLSVFSSTRKSSLTFKEKLFISWVGPRGIVAAGIASLFGTKLAVQGVPGAEYITPLVFMIVLGTVLLNATLAGPIAKKLGVLLQKSNGIIIFGGHKAARMLGEHLSQKGNHVVIVDSNGSNISNAKKLGIPGIQANIYTDDLADSVELADMGYLLALTSNTEVNEYAIKKFGKEYGENGSYRLISQEEYKNPEDRGSNLLFSIKNDYINFIEIARDFPNIFEIEIDSSESLAETLDTIDHSEYTMPLYIQKPDNSVSFVLVDKVKEIDILEGSKLICLGKELEA